MRRTHAPTFHKWHKKKRKNNKNKKMTLHMLTHGAMCGCGCGLTSLAVCIIDKFRDIRERNVTMRSEIWSTNICSLGFQDIRKCVTLWGLILRNLESTTCPIYNPLDYKIGKFMFLCTFEPSFTCLQYSVFQDGCSVWAHRSCCLLDFFKSCNICFWIHYMRDFRCP